MNYINLPCGGQTQQADCYIADTSDIRYVNNIPCGARYSSVTTYGRGQIPFKICEDHYDADTWYDVSPDMERSLNNFIKEYCYMVCNNNQFDKLVNLIQGRLHYTLYFDITGKYIKVVGQYNFSEDKNTSVAGVAVGSRGYSHICTLRGLSVAFIESNETIKPEYKDVVPNRVGIYIKFSQDIADYLNESIDASSKEETYFELSVLSINRLSESLLPQSAVTTNNINSVLHYEELPFVIDGQTVMKKVVTIDE